MEYRILGPLEVLDDSRPLPLGNLKERMVLAVLLLHANEFVSRERLIDELWGVAPPPTARKAVNVYVSKLRKTLSCDGQDPVATVDGGYRLAADPERLDAERARRLLAAAREQMAAGEAAAASRLLRDALALWRGPALAGLALESIGRDEVAELDELRINALMDRIDCELAQGGHELLLGELQILVREHPLRERFRAQQMLALYRAERQADALDAYSEARRSLIDELGIEPSESLQRLQQAILRHDPTLELPSGTAAVNGAAPAPAAGTVDSPAALPARSGFRRRPLHWRHLLAVGLVAVVAAAALAVFLSTRGGGARPPASAVSYVAPNTIAQLNPATGAHVSDVGGGLDPGPMAVAGKMFWVAGRADAHIGRYDMSARRGTPPFQVAPAVDDIAVDAEGHAWVSDRKPVVTWIGHIRGKEDPYATPVVTTKPVPVPLPGAGAEAVGAGYLWVISDLPGRFGQSVALVDVRHRRLASTIALGRQTTAIAYGYGSAWVGGYSPRDSTAWLSRARPGSTSTVESIELEGNDGAGPLAVAAGEGSVWVITSRGNLLGIDPRTLRIVHRISMSAELPTLLAVGGGSLWTANHRGYGVSQIDPRAEKIVRTTPLGSYRAVPCGITATHRTVFVAFGETTCG